MIPEGFARPLLGFLPWGMPHGLAGVMANVVRSNAETMLHEPTFGLEGGVPGLQIGGILKKYRALWRMTQVELAQRTGVVTRRAVQVALHRPSFFQKRFV